MQSFCGDARSCKRQQIDLVRTGLVHTPWGLFDAGQTAKQTRGQLVTKDRILKWKTRGEGRPIEAPRQMVGRRMPPRSLA